MTYLQSVSVLKAVCDQLSFGELVQPRQLPATMTTSVESGESLVATFQLEEGTTLCEYTSHHVLQINTLFQVYKVSAYIKVKYKCHALDSCKAQETKHLKVQSKEVSTLDRWERS